MIITDNIQPQWQERAQIAEQLSMLMLEYQMRKSKLIKYTPTDKELKEAMRFYMHIQDLAKEKDPNGIQLMKLLNSISTVSEEQIKFTGFMDEVLGKYASGKVPGQVIMDLAEKWDVLDYIVEDIITALGIEVGKFMG